MKQFDIYLIDLNPTRGSEINKKRPAVIVSPDEMNKHLKTVIIAPLTHSIKNYPSRVASDFDGQLGEIALDQLRAVDKSRLTKKLGRLDAATAADIKSVLRTMFS
jgi:mRNA interferase MazF